MSVRSWVEGKVAALMVRAIVSRVDDTLAGQGLQLRGLKDEAPEVEHLLPYGFTSVPLTPSADGTGAEALVLFLGGSRSGGIAIAVGDRRYRLTGLPDGEVAIYDDLGQKVHLTRTKIVVEAPLVEIGSGAVLTAANGVVTGLGLDPHTGMTQFALRNASALLRAG